MTTLIAHIGIGSLGACTCAGTRRFCKHRFWQFATAAVFIVAEAAATTQLVG